MQFLNWLIVQQITPKLNSLKHRTFIFTAFFVTQKSRSSARWFWPGIFHPRPWQVLQVPLPNWPMQPSPGGLSSLPTAHGTSCGSAQGLGSVPTIEQGSPQSQWSKSKRWRWWRGVRMSFMSWSHLFTSTISRLREKSPDTVLTLKRKLASAFWMEDVKEFVDIFLHHQTINCFLGNRAIQYLQTIFAIPPASAAEPMSLGDLEDLERWNWSKFWRLGLVWKWEALNSKGNSLCEYRVRPLGTTDIFMP